jgi:N-hydroxyarylamine O-acetyltransferase
MNINRYLERIAIEKKQNPSLSFLTILQSRHLLSIPFEDLDIPSRRIELDLHKLYNKIIISKRGGFCYELNGLFYWLLINLGYKVDMLSARVFNSRKQDFGPDFDHMALLVHLEKDYLVDVGFGDSFRAPIEFPKGQVEDISGRYRIMNSGKDNFELQKASDNKWEPQYRFSIAPTKLEDFKSMCDFQQDSPTSSFRTGMLCTIATESGRITLSKNTLTITENETKYKSNIDDLEDFYIMLKKHFSIAL